MTFFDNDNRPIHITTGIFDKYVDAFNNFEEPYGFAESIKYYPGPDCEEIFREIYTDELHWELQHCLLAKIDSHEARMFAIHCLAGIMNVNLDGGDGGVWLRELYRQEILKEEHSNAEANPPEAEQKRGGIPDEFQTPEAKQVFQRLIEKGIVDENYMPTDKVKTNKLKVYLARKINKEAKMAIRPYSDRDKISCKWKPFQDLWGMKDMANINQKMDRPEGYEIVDDVFRGFKLTTKQENR